jgi:NADH dehydrogenase/NADH:ubiquinone oxidoreductase subunit G
VSRKIEVSVNGSTIPVDSSATVLEAALERGFFVPHLCHHPDLEPAGVCRLCLVDVDGRLVTACNTQVTPGAEIRTDTEAVKETRLGATTASCTGSRASWAWTRRA